MKKVGIEILIIIVPAAILLGMVWGMNMVRDDVSNGERISVWGSVYSCKQLKSGY